MNSSRDAIVAMNSQQQNLVLVGRRPKSERIRGAVELVDSAMAYGQF